jgi:hypothetical protein
MCEERGPRSAATVSSPWLRAIYAKFRVATEVDQPRVPRHMTPEERETSGRVRERYGFDPAGGEATSL